MTPKQKILNLLQTNKKTLVTKYNVKSMGIFGSFIKGGQTKNSDVDVLVEFSEVPDFFEFLKLEQFLKKIFRRKVDLVTKDALKPLIKDEILKQTVYVV